MKLQSDPDFRALGPLTLTSSILGLIVATNLSDSTYGWHGARTGLSLYYYHWEQESSERQELALTSDMVLTSSLTLKKTMLLGAPYTSCTHSGHHQQCDLVSAGSRIQEQCHCKYEGFRHNNQNNSIRFTHTL